MEDGREEVVLKVASAWSQNDTIAVLGTNCTLNESKTKRDSSVVILQWTPSKKTAQESTKSLAERRP